MNQIILSPSPAMLLPQIFAPTPKAAQCFVEIFTAPIQCQLATEGRMAAKKKGTLTTAGEWWKHLRPWVERQFWKAERRAAKQDAGKQVKEG